MFSLQGSVISSRHHLCAAYVRHGGTADWRSSVAGVVNLIVNLLLYLLTVVTDARDEAVYRAAYYNVVHIVLKNKKIHVMRLTT